MKFWTACISILFAVNCHAQLLSWSPDFIQEPSTPMSITCDASKGNKGLFNYLPVSDVYVHIGCITTASTSSTDWKYAPFAWATTNALAKCTSLDNNKWQYVISGGLRAFFGITNASEKILKIAILFRNGAGTNKLANTDGSDMYVPVYDAGLAVRIDTPFRQPGFFMSPESITRNIGDAVAINAKSNLSSGLQLFFNGNSLTTAAAATSVSASTVISVPGMQTIIALANNGTVSARDTFSFFVGSSVNVAALPSGVKDGINYEPGDTSVTLVLYAPLKNSVAVIGDFNNWLQTSQHQMNKTPDGNRFWLRINGLTPGTEYAYQYLIDGSLKVADYTTEKILDPSNDPYIAAVTYPNLKAYPTGKTTGIVSIFQTAKPVYNWQATGYTRPDKRNLVIYELLVRDFIGAANFQTLKDTLTYLKRLGVNAIEVMPFNEFEGNLSWGYNPNFYFAPDKYYGTETAVRQFIDACHQQGIAVIMDMVMNHAMGSCPMAQMYWDGTNNIPAANNPWFNQHATHPFSVGNDFNHESQATKDLVAAVVRHWLTKYKVDGFRWDLSKGFTQTNNPNNVGAWGNYDAGRVATWKRIYDTMQAVTANSYCILEHFADNSEETELANYGMLLWGNENYAYNQATMGYTSGSDFSWGISKNRGWANPYLVTYQESHDEERLAYKNINYGNSAASYNIKDSATALQRNAMAAAFWAMTPGPKLMWQFGELGYDYSINTCADFSINNNCRTDSKPVRWNYYNNANRNALFTVYAKLFKLRLTPNYFTTFTTGNITWDMANSFKSMILNDDSLKVVVLGNFDVTAQTRTVTFPTAGTWYSYLTGTTKAATGNAESIILQPGDYYVYTNKNVTNSVVTAIAPVGNDISNMQVSIVPNPVYSPATIMYTLPENGNVTICVMNMEGRKLATLFNGFRAKGVRVLPLNSNGLNTAQLANGMYLLQIQVNGKKRTEKFIIIK